MINKDIQINIPDSVEEILNRLHENGYEAYIVGGCVRDVLLGREPKDWDITTSALPLEVKALFHNTVDTGIQHGTVMVIKHGEGYEVTTYRVDGEYKDGRHPSSVTFTRSLEEDLKRRDFTINAFAWDEQGLIDMFDGISDLENGVIRCVGNPDERFNEDALRIMRAVRFSAQLGFEIETETRAMIGKYKGRLADISRERIRVEFEKTLLSPNPSVVNEYAKLGLDRYIIGEGFERCFDGSEDDYLYEIIRREKATEENDYHEFYRQLRMAVFFRNLTARETDKAFKALKYDNKTRESVVKIIEHKDDVFTLDRPFIKNKLNELGPDTLMSILEFNDITHSDKKYLEEVNSIKTMVDDVLESKEPWRISHLAVNGSELMEAGIPAGKVIGDALNKILQSVIINPELNNKNMILDPDFIRTLIKGNND